MSSLKTQILELRKQKLSYNEIQKRLNCSKSTISYHCSKNGKEKSRLRRQKHRYKSHPFKEKFDRFIYTNRGLRKKKPPISTIQILFKQKIHCFCSYKKDKKRMYQQPTFTLQDVINKFGDTPKCYLTGDSIDIHKPETYQFDHITPRSRGGDNSLDNLQICIKHANIAKNDLLLEEFIDLCKKVVQLHCTQ